jgi:hypothetical protein
MAKTVKHKNSTDLESVLRYFRETVLQHDHAKESVSIHDKKTNDFNHALELEDLNYADRARLATKQMENLKQRRAAKDYVYECQALVDVLSSPEGMRFINKLNEALGAMRKQEKQHESRVYKKRFQ